MFNKWLEEMRKKDDFQKKQIAFFLSLIITSIIFVIWLIFFLYSLNNIINPLNTTLNYFDNIFGKVGEQFSIQFENTKGLFDQLISQFNI